MNNNPCLDCGFYDFDFGCTCSPLDKRYACSLEPEPSVEDFLTESEMNHCKICGCLMSQDHKSDICECCRDEYGDLLPDKLRGSDTS